MRLAINLDSLTFVNPENPAVAARSVTMRRNDVLPLEVVFFKGGQRYELPDSAGASIQINKKDDFGGSGLADDDAFVKTGSGVDAAYRFDLTLQGTPINTAFSGSPPAASINASLEIKIDDGTYIQRTEPLAVMLQNAIAQS